MPTLDFEVKMREDGSITYRFYEKPMATPYCIMAEAAMSEESKKAILSQEVKRRMEHTEESEDMSVRIRILDDFNKKMKRSGYEEEKRAEIFR